MTKSALLFVTKLHFDKEGNGGQQRTYFLIKELSKYYDLFVLSPYTENEAPNIDAHFIVNKAVSYEKILRQTKVSRLILKVLNWLLKNQEATKPIHQSNFATYILKKQIRRLQSKSINSIVFDTLSVVVDLESNLFTNKILNAHNFDSELVQMNLDNKLSDSKTDAQDIKNTKKHLATLKRYEHNIDIHFSEIWVCSLEDALKFKAVNPNTSVRFFELPNGSDPTARPFQPMTNQYQKMLFVGSLNYFPNVNGLQWFVETIFKHLPDSFELNIVGRSPNQDDFSYIDAYPNVHLIGEVDYVESYYKNHDAFVVPLLEGSGTRLKILEAMSYGKLVLSTPKGIEGIAAKDGIDYLEFNNFESFETNILDRLDDIKGLETIRKNGRQFIENSYSWETIVKNYVKQRHEQ